MTHSLREAWADLLSRYQWDWFATFTFRTHTHPEAADKLFRVWTSKLNRDIYGVRWYKQPQGGVTWIRALEWQKRGVIHYHALVSGKRDLNTEARRLTYMDLWFDLAGIARIEPAQNAEAVNRYVSKYVVKGGELDVSSNLDLPSQVVRTQAVSCIGTIASGAGFHPQRQRQDRCLTPEACLKHGGSEKADFQILDKLRLRQCTLKLQTPN